MDAYERSNRARENFLAGYNCAQSVALAFSDLFEERGISRELLAQMISGFGGGMGRLREMCGAVSASIMVLGLCQGYSDPADYEAKSELYAKVQEVAGRFRGECGSYLCRELLGLGEGPDVPVPERRGDAYYASRPCQELCATGARIISEYLGGI